jgi:hypothetical protein
MFHVLYILNNNEKRNIIIGVDQTTTPPESRMVTDYKLKKKLNEKDLPHVFSYCFNMVTPPPLLCINTQAFC